MWGLMTFVNVTRFLPFLCRNMSSCTTCICCGCHHLPSMWVSLTMSTSWAIVSGMHSPCLHHWGLQPQSVLTCFPCSPQWIIHSTLPAVLQCLQQRSHIWHSLYRFLDGVQQCCCCSTLRTAQTSRLMVTGDQGYTN